MSREVACEFEEKSESPNPETASRPRLTAIPHFALQPTSVPFGGKKKKKKKKKCCEKYKKGKQCKNCPLRF